jgi:hypothetical protein
MLAQFTATQQDTIERGESRYAELGVGDLVIATIDGGSQLVTCRIYAIENTCVKFLWNAVVFSVEIELAAMTTILIEKFNRQQLIAEIMAMVA